MGGFFSRYDFPIHADVAVGFVRHRISEMWHTATTRWWLALIGCRVGKGFRVCGRPVLRLDRRGSLSFGENVTLVSRLRSNLAGGVGPTIIQCIGSAKVVFGDNSGCSFAVFSSRASITVGNDVMIGANARIYDHDFHPVHYEVRRSTPTDNVSARPVVIKDHAFIGANALILKGVTIGYGSVVGAGSVVTRDVPDGEIWAGNPAVRVGEISRFQAG